MLAVFALLIAFSSVLAQPIPGLHVVAKIGPAVSDTAYSAVERQEQMKAERQRILDEYWIAQGNPGFHYIPSNLVLPKIPDRGDTLSIEASVGDTVRLELYGVHWPVVNGYYVKMDAGVFKAGHFTMPTFEPGDFLPGPDLPTAQTAALLVDGGLQVGLVTLGERSDSGAGCLGTLTFEALSFPEGAEKVSFAVNRFVLQSRTDSTGLYIPLGLAAHILVELTVGPPPPVEITADFDGSGTVDFADFIRFAGIFGAMEGRDANYDARFDLALNGSIDFADFILFAADFGHAPTVIRIA